MPTDVAIYTAAQSEANKDLCKKLKEAIAQELKKAEHKAWHGSPVWFIDGNPIVGYSVRKHGVHYCFRADGRSPRADCIPKARLRPRISTIKEVGEIKVTELRGWLKRAKCVRLDYRNIIKRRGMLVKIGSW